MIFVYKETNSYIQSFYTPVLPKGVQGLDRFVYVVCCMFNMMHFITSNPICA